MIVESHSHISVKVEGMEEIKPWYGKEIAGVQRYFEIYDQNGVEACWVFGSMGLLASDYIRKENEALARLQGQYPKRLFPWGMINANWPEDILRREVRRMAMELGLYGIKLIPTLQGIPLSGSGMDVVAEEAMNLDFPIFFHDGSPEYCSAIQVACFARKYPRLRVVSGHGGLRELWPDHVRIAKDLPNLWICLSGPPQLGLQRLYDALGPERLLWGSDGGLGTPVVVKAHLRRMERLQAPPRHKDMMLGENAMRFLFGDKWKEYAQ